MLTVLRWARNHNEDKLGDWQKVVIRGMMERPRSGPAGRRDLQTCDCLNLLWEKLGAYILSFAENGVWEITPQDFSPPRYPFLIVSL